MVKALRLFLNSSILSLVFLNCSAPISQNKATLENIPPSKILTVFDCLVLSEPSPDIIEFAETKNLCNKLSIAYNNRFKGDATVEFVKNIQTIGYGSELNNKKMASKESSFNSINPQLSANDSVQNINSTTKGILYSLCSTGSLMYDTSEIYYPSVNFKVDSNIAKLNMLKKLTNADYCIINSVYGTIKRKPLSNGVRIATAIATGLLSALSPVGGFIFVPGDETVFRSQSFLINMTTGKIEWSKKYYLYRVYAVEQIDETLWANKVFHNFRIKSRYKKQHRIDRVPQTSFLIQGN